MGKRIKKRYLVRTVLSVALISLLPVAVMGIITNSKITRAINNELVTANEQILQLTSNTIESVISQMKNACVQLKNDQVFLTFQQLEHGIDWYEQLASFETEEEMQQMYQYLSVKGQIFDRLSAEKVTNSFVDSVYYIDWKKKAILTSDRQLLFLDEFYDKQLLEDLNAQIGSLGMIERAAEGRDGVLRNELSIFYGAKYQGDSQVVVMNLNPVRFFEYLQEKVFTKNENHFFVLQNNKNLISDASFTKEEETAILEQLGQEDTAELAREVTVGDVNYYLSGVFSESLHWWIFSLTKANELFEPSNYTKRIILTICITLAAVICVAILLWSVNWYKPIRKITEELAKDRMADTAGGSPKNEMAYIYDSLQSMSKEKRSLQGRIQQMMPHFQEKYVSSLLHKEEIVQSLAEEQFRYLNIQLQPEQICLIAIQVWKGTQRDQAGNLESTVEQSICIQEVIRDIFDREVKSYFVLPDLGRFTVILNWKKEEMVRLLQICQSCGERFEITLGVDYSVGISRVHQTVEEIQEAYQEALQALSCSMFEGCKVAYIEDIIVSDGHKSHKDYEVPMTIFSAIRSGKQEESVKELLLYLKKMTLAYDNFSYARVSNLFLRLLSRLFDLLEEMELHDEETECLLVLSNEELIKGNELLAMEAMKRAVAQLAGVCQERLVSKNEDRIQGVKAVIEEKYCDSTLSLTEVAELMDLNPDYLSRIFKENTGKTFSEYLTYVRIKKSMTFLKETNMKIKEISEAVGYNNTNYFNKVFKEYMKVTPQEYRLSL